MVRLAVCACDLRHACATVPVAGARARHVAHARRRGDAASYRRTRRRRASPGVELFVVDMKVMNTEPTRLLFAIKTRCAPRSRAPRRTRDRGRGRDVAARMGMHDRADRCAECSRRKYRTDGAGRGPVGGNAGWRDAPGPPHRAWAHASLRWRARWDADGPVGVRWRERWDAKECSCSVRWGVRDGLPMVL